MIKRIEYREYKKVWSQEILHKLCFMSSKLIKKYRILYTKVRGEMEQSQQNTMGQSQQEANKEHCTKGTQDISRALRLSTQWL